MTEPNEYAQLLRAIRRALEILQFGSFSMEFTGGDFVVHGSAPASMEQEEARAIRQRVIKFVWEALPGERASDAEIEFAMSTWPAEIDLYYTAKDMDRLEQQGKAKRQTVAGVPDVASLSSSSAQSVPMLSKRRPGWLGSLATETRWRLNTILSAVSGGRRRYLRLACMSSGPSYIYRDPGLAKSRKRAEHRSER